MSPLLAISVLLALLFCGITVDLGLVEYNMLHMQRAADAAARGAQVSHDQEDANWQNNGVLDAGLNGFTNGSSNATVRVVSPPTAGTYAGDYDAVQATVSAPYQELFMSILSGGNLTLATTAIALETPCVYILGTHPTASVPYSLTLANGASIGNWSGSSMGCPVYVNSGVSVSSTSSLWGNATNVTGGAGSSSLLGGVTHPPHFGATAQGDPLTYVGACAHLSSQCIHGTSSGIEAPPFSGCTFANQPWPSGTFTLQPNTYCNSFNFSNANVTLAPGLYIITGGATWRNSTVTGSGVTLYFTQRGDGNYGQFVVNNTQVSVSAPTTSAAGGIPTILLMNDPNWVQTSAQDFSFLNGSSSTGDGIYYISGAGLSIANSPFSATHYLCFDVDNLLITASAVYPLSNFSPVPTGNPFTPIGNLVQ